MDVILFFKIGMFYELYEVQRLACHLGTSLHPDVQTDMHLLNGDQRSNCSGLIVKRDERSVCGDERSVCRDLVLNRHQRSDYKIPAAKRQCTNYDHWNPWHMPLPMHSAQNLLLDLDLEHRPTFVTPTFVSMTCIALQMAGNGLL